MVENIAVETQFCENYAILGMIVFTSLQALKNAWEIACSFPTRTRILIPSGSTYLVHPVDIAGPCRSKVTLVVCMNRSYYLLYSFFQYQY